MQLSRRARAALLLLSAVTALAAGPARAHDGTHTGDEWPLLTQATHPQGWASFKVHTDGGKIAVQLHNGGFTSPVTVGFALYDENDSFIYAIGFTAYYARTGYKVMVNGVPGAPVHLEETVDEYSNATGGGGMTPVITPPGPATYKILVWAAAKSLKDWSYRLRAEDGTLLALDAGAGSFIYLTDDFEGVAQANVDVVGAGARASIGLDKVIDVRDRLFGWYLQPFVAGCCQATTLASPNANLMSVTTPKGEEDCLLGCDYWFPTDTTGPGRYTFHITGAGASALSHGDDVTLMGLDARLPA